MKQFLFWITLTLAFVLCFLPTQREPQQPDVPPPSTPRIIADSSSTLNTLPNVRHHKQIALTFDACPHAGPAGFDSKVASVLADSNVAATIFVSGKWALQHPAEIALLAANPLFEIGNHSHSHPHMTTLPPPRLKEELLLPEAIFDSLGISHVPLYRPPFGETTPFVDSVVRCSGLRTVMFDVVSGDPDSSFHRARLVRSVVGSAKDGSIVVLHINGRGWHTAEALPDIITGLRRKGFRFVRVSELLGAETPSTTSGRSNAAAK